MTDHDLQRSATITPQAPDRHYAPIRHLVRARLLEFVREPEAVFWVCVFPIMMIVALGVAFRNQRVDQSTIDIVQDETSAAAMQQTLDDSGRFHCEVHTPEECDQRLRTSKTDLVVAMVAKNTADMPEYAYKFDPARAESVLARAAVDDVLQRAAGRRDVIAVRDVSFDEIGARYIDFLVPGLLGMSIMGGGMWGIGFVTVDLRIRKLLKRFLATPLRKTDFLAGIMISRLVFLIPEVLIVLLFSRLFFGVQIHGSIAALCVVIFLGTVAFAGLGLLVASRANTVEAVSGLMNLVMLPMWMLSGIFFSSTRFPEMAQPIIRLLPLTPLVNMLRGIMQEGTSLFTFWPEMGILSIYAVVCFVLALRWFRWS